MKLQKTKTEQTPQNMWGRPKGKAVDIIKRIAAFMLALCIVTIRCTSQVTFANMTVTENSYTAIVAKDIEKYGRLFNINGDIKESQTIPDMHGGIVSSLNDETEIAVTGYFANTTDYNNEKNIYSKQDVNINSSTAKTKNVIMAEKNITINTSEIKSEEFTILYAKNGNININTSEMNFKGILYAPKGEIIINGSNVNIYGCLLAEKAKFYTEVMNVNADRYTDNIIKILMAYRNDALLTLTGYTCEEKIYVGFETESDYESVDIYIRNDNETKFTYLASTTEAEYEISEYKFENYMDIMAVAKTAYGDTYDSTLMKVGYSNDEYAEKLCSYAIDTDEDGIMDGIEVWYSKTNPNNSDSDGDGIDDYTECMLLCTDPNVKNKENDTDKDGITDRGELENDTHPYLKDTDFDGYTDDEDAEPLRYNEGSNNEIDYSEEVVIGLFDKVSTWVDEKGNLYQYIYNFINDNVKYTMINGVITKYYYDTDDKLTAVVTINEDTAAAVTYTYNGDILNSVAYKGLLYDFAIDENSENISIAGQQYKNVVYKDTEQIIRYGNGFEIKSTYNEYGDVIAVYYNGKPAFECEYDEKGQVVKVSDYISKFIQAYTYEEDGSIAEITSENYNITYQYSDEEYVIDYNVKGQEYRQVIYNDIEDKYASQYSSLLISGGLHENIENESGDIEYKITDIQSGRKIFSNLLKYGEDGRLTDIIYNSGKSEGIEYAKDGKINKILQNGTKVLEYYYDSLGRVVREDNALSGKTYEYIYNADNNMEERRTYSYTTGELTEPETIEKYTYGNAWKDQITGINGENIAYDAVGNPILYRDGMNLEWNGKILSGVSIGNDKIGFTYNNEGIRTSKTVNGEKTEYIIEGKDIVFETNDKYTVAYIYNSDMNVMGMIYNGETYYFEKNVQSDVVRILDSEGNVKCEYIYDAWGSIVKVNGDEELAKINPFRYRSYYCDNETGLYYVESRYYDPETGRFINPDKIEGIVWDYSNLNMYVYCSNDPLNYYDPSGAAPIYVKTFISRDIYSDPKINSTSGSIPITNYNWIQSMGLGGSNVTYIIDDKMDFIDCWNSLLNATVVVINAHGTPRTMQFGNEYLTTEDVSVKLLRKPIKFVWLISCNTGHYDWRNENIAKGIATKVTGLVIAPDGIASGNMYVNPEDRGFIARVEEGEENIANGWYYYCHSQSSYRKECYGWLRYKYSGSSSKYGERTPFNRYVWLNISSLSNYLVNNGYVSYK